jgi:hypothetical protein
VFQLGKTIVSEDIIEKDFMCNLSACKGACCVGGDAGAPLEEEEVKILQKIYPKIKPFLRPEGIKVIEEQGVFVTLEDGELETPLVNNENFAYVSFDNRGVAICGIEEAYNQGEISWKNLCHAICILLELKITVSFRQLITINGKFVMTLVL